MSIEERTLTTFTNLVQCLNGQREPNPRKVLLDVIKSSESTTVHWLTINEVNQ